MQPLGFRPARNTFACQLLDRKMSLALMPTIPDMKKYAQDWADLAAEFERIGFTFSAENCRERARHYGNLALDTPGNPQWERTVEGRSFVDLIPVEVKQPHMGAM